MKYADLSRKHRALEKLESATPTKQYWAASVAFKLQLRHALRDDELMWKLTKLQLLKVLAWCSTFRPYEPHVILTTFSKLCDRAGLHPPGA